ncbi:hypothetical protein GCM10022291_08640 [Postechiella marina]|uniref:DUF2383 domain-containing protein n=1 Tax=Postechiella marina TaxID=943941 RepID=A0ABP8C338_9FLAO
MKYTEKISNELNELLVKNYDARKGYLNAIDNVDSHTLKQFFERMATERGEFARELKNEILTYQETPKEAGSIAGAVHRNWITLKNLFSSNDEEAILDEVVRGEKASLESYANVMVDNELSKSIKTLLNKHTVAIKKTIKSIHKFEELVS